MVNRVGPHFGESNEQYARQKLKQGAVGDPRGESLRRGGQPSEISPNHRSHAE